jgi:hypothetical protein
LPYHPPGIARDSDHVAVLRHGDLDWLNVVRTERGQIGTIEQAGDTARNPGLTLDQSGLLEAQHHLVNGRRDNAEEPDHVRLGRRASVHQRTRMNENQVLALLGVKSRRGSAARLIVVLNSGDQQ